MKTRVSGVLAAVVAIAIGGFASYWLNAQRHHTASAEAGVSYWLETPAARQDVAAAIQAAGAVPVSTANRSAADLVITASATPGATGILPEDAGAPASPSAQNQFVSPERKATAYAAPGPHAGNPALVRSVISRLAQTAAPAAASWTMDVVGDIGLGRSIYTSMAARGDFDYPFAAFKPELQSADLSIANLECAVSDQHAVITDSGMTFVTPVKAAAGLKDAGIDAVSVANNHSFNGGPGGYTDTLSALNNLGVLPFGGGNNDAQAHAPTILKVKGLRVALLGYSSIVGSTAAGASSPGMAYISMAPWGPFSEPDVSRMEQDIKAARKQADLVIAYYHWGTEYTHDANADQRTVAHRAIDAGVDVVLGSHPHWAQGVEWYNGHLIDYSLGNFIFDQAWSDETTRSAALKLTFQGTKLQSAKFLPYDITGNAEPVPASPASSAKTISEIFAHSWWPALDGGDSH